MEREKDEKKQVEEWFEDKMPFFTVILCFLGPKMRLLKNGVLERKLQLGEKETKRAF